MWFCYQIQRCFPDLISSILLLVSYSVASSFVVYILHEKSYMGIVKSIKSVLFMNMYSIRRDIADAIVCQYSINGFEYNERQNSIFMHNLEKLFHNGWTPYTYCGVLSSELELE